jgi:hypothetical protein
VRLSGICRVGDGQKGKVLIVPANRARDTTPVLLGCNLDGTNEFRPALFLTAL